MKRKLLYLIAALILILSIFAGCGKTGTPSPAPTDNAAGDNTPAPADEPKDETLLVGFSAGYSMVQHWELEMKGCQAAADELGAEFIYQFANGDGQKQVADIETMVEMGIDMLIVGPCNSEGIVPTVNELKAKNIPVMTSDIGISGTDVVAHVASDNYQIGVMAANYIGEMLGGKGKIAVVGWAAASATKDREDGFVATITEKYPDIVIVVNQDVGGERAKSLEITENILQSNSDLDAIFGCNAEIALGAYAATTATNRTEVQIISVDTDAEVMDAIKAGSNLCATIAQNPFEMGYQAMITAIKHLRGESVSDVAIGTEVVTKDNVQSFIDRDQANLKEITLKN